MPQSLPGPPVAPLGKGFSRASDALAPSPLKRIAATILVIGLLYGAIYSLAEGTAAERFAQVGAAIGVVVYLLTFVDILLGIGFLIACVALSPEMAMGEMSNLRLEDFLIPALLLSWIARSARDREPMIGSPLKAPALAYLAFMIVSTLVGVSAGTTNPLSATLVIFKYVEYYLLFLLILNNVRTAREFKAMAVFAVLAAGASAAITLGGDASTVAASARLHGPAGETANIFGGFLVLHLGIALGFVVFGREMFLKVACGAAALLMANAVLTTLSRTSYAALAIALLVVGLALERKLLALLVAGSIALLALGSESTASRTNDLLNVISGGRNDSLDARIMAWDMILANLTGIHLLLGRGTGSVRLGDVDSEYFKVLADMGVAGFLLFGWALLKVGGMAYATYKRQPPRTFGHAYSVGFLLAFVGILVHAFAATSFTSIRTMEGFMILAGLMASLHHRREEWEAEDREVAAAHARWR